MSGGYLTRKLVEIGTQRTAEMNESTELQIYRSHDEQIILPELGDYLAIETYFKLKQIKYKVNKVFNGEDMSPDGVMPFIFDGEQLVSGFAAIIKHVLKMLNPKSEFTDLPIRLSLYSNIFHNSEIEKLWNTDSIYEKFTYPRYGHASPPQIRWLLCWLKRRQMRNKLAYIEDSKKSFDEVCRSLGSTIQSDSFLEGTTLSELDAFVYGHLKAIQTTQDDIPELWEEIETYASIGQYVTKMDALVYPSE